MSNYEDAYYPGTEELVIEELGPPLNLAGNASHPFHAEMSARRRAFRAAAQ